MASSSQKRDTKKTLKTFEAIKSFVDDVHTCFSTPGEVTPLVLLWRLLEHISKSNNINVKNTVVDGFESFFKVYDDFILEDKMTSIPSGTRIDYKDGKHMYIDLSDIIKRSDEDTLIVIRQHLMTISTILNPDDKKIQQMEIAERHNTVLAVPNDGSPEAAFISNIVAKAKNSLSDMDPENPAAGLMGLVNSGIMQDMYGGLQAGITDGSLDLRKMFTLMQNAVGSFMPPPDPRDGAPQDNIHLPD